MPEQEWGFVADAGSGNDITQFSKNNILNSKFKTSESAVSTILINDRDVMIATANLDTGARDFVSYSQTLLGLNVPKRSLKKLNSVRQNICSKSSTKACRRTLNKCLNFIHSIRPILQAWVTLACRTWPAFQVRTFSTVVNIFKLLSIAIRCLPNFFLVNRSCHYLSIINLFHRLAHYSRPYFLESLVRKI